MIEKQTNVFNKNHTTLIHHTWFRAIFFIMNHILKTLSSRDTSKRATTMVGDPNISSTIGKSFSTILTLFVTLKKFSPPQFSLQETLSHLSLYSTAVVLWQNGLAGAIWPQHPSITSNPPYPFVDSPSLRWWLQKSQARIPSKKFNDMWPKLLLLNSNIIKIANFEWGKREWTL